MVIAVVNSLCGVVGGQVVRRRGVLGRTGPTPLTQRLLGAVRAVDVVADHSRFAGGGHGHVEDPGVVLRAREVLRAAGGRAHLVRALLGRVVVGNGGDVGDSGLEAAASGSAVGAADAGGRRGRLPVLVGPEE